MAQKLLLSIAAFVIICLQNNGGDALKCYQCTSYTDAQCADPFFFEDKGGKKTIKAPQFLKECPNDGNEYTLCRKIFQNVRGEERVIRTCGWEEYQVGEEIRDCYTTVLEEYNTYVCTCKDEGCNSAIAGKASVVAILATVVFAYLI